MFNIFKYRLLEWLLDDICRQTECCAKCICACPVQIQIGDETIDGRGCEHQNVKYQAAKIWRVENNARRK